MLMIQINHFYLRRCPYSSYSVWILITWLTIVDVPYINILHRSITLIDYTTIDLHGPTVLITIDRFHRSILLQYINPSINQSIYCIYLLYRSAA